MVTAEKSEKNKRTCNPSFIYHIEIDSKEKGKIIELDKRYKQEYYKFHALFGNILLSMVDIAEKDTPSKNTRNTLQKRKEQSEKIDYNLIVIRVQVDFPDTSRLRESKTEGNQIYLYINKNNIESLVYDETALEFLKRITSTETSKKRPKNQMDIKDDTLGKKMQKTLDEMNDD
jgi:hypothetical protein